MELAESQRSEESGVDGGRWTGKQAKSLGGDSGGESILRLHYLHDPSGSPPDCSHTDREAPRNGAIVRAFHEQRKNFSVLIGEQIHCLTGSAISHALASHVTGRSLWSSEWTSALTRVNHIIAIAN